MWSGQISLDTLSTMAYTPYVNSKELSTALTSQGRVPLFVAPKLSSSHAGCAAMHLGIHNSGLACARAAWPRPRDPLRGARCVIVRLENLIHCLEVRCLTSTRFLALKGGIRQVRFHFVPPVSRPRVPTQHGPSNGKNLARNTAA